MTSRQELADGGPPKHAVARSAASRRQNAAMARRKAPRVGNNTRYQLPDAPSRRAIPSYLRDEGKTGLPRAATKNRGGEALVSVIPGRKR